MTAQNNNYMQLALSRSIWGSLRELAKRLFPSLFWKLTGVFAIVVRAIHESRREAARRILDDHGQLLDDHTLPEAKHQFSFRHRADSDELRRFVVCPITARQCETGLSGLCPEYGCARKAGLLPQNTLSLVAKSAANSDHIEMYGTCGTRPERCR